MGAIPQIIDDPPSTGASYNQQVSMGLAQPFGVTNRSTPSRFQLPTLADFASSSGVLTIAPFGPPTTLAQPKQTHSLYPNRLPPIPIIHSLKCGQVSHSTGPSLMPGTITGIGPITSALVDLGRGWLPTGPTLPLGRGNGRVGY